MKKLVVMALAALFIANVASAVVDPDDNQMGIYFDMNGEVFEDPAGGAFVPVSAYILFTNPTVSAILGYEFSHTIVGNILPPSIAYNGVGAIPVTATEGVLVGLGAPLVCSPATLIATISFVALDTNPVAFTLAGAVPNSVPGGAGPAVLLEGSAILGCGLSAGFAEDGTANVCALWGSEGIVSTDEVSIDQIKALYK